MILDQLPPRLSDEVGGYVDSVAFSTRDIYRDADVETDAVSVSTFLTFAGIWRIWTQVESQRWLMENSLAMSADHGIDGVRFGSDQIRRNGREAEEARTLQAQLGQLLNQHNASFIRTSRGLRDVLTGLAASGGGRAR